MKLYKINFYLAVLSIEVNGDHWKMVSESSYTNWVTEFSLGREAEIKTADGRVMKVN
jgi:hypothetical protein